MTEPLRASVSSSTKMRLTRVSTVDYSRRGFRALPGM